MLEEDDRLDSEGGLSSPIKFVPSRNCAFSFYLSLHRPDKAAQAFGVGMETSSRETAVSCGLSKREDVLTTSLGPGPVTYVSEPHAIEFELQAGSLDEELSLGMTITRNLAFVDCRTEGSSR